ncbi:hypothetical protein GCK72_007872 [Caenorhabditis remanei]|uniref:DUF38 domain-containing protein n=1 Tax=Caenorhabditis remanei TaxID=31234 RepID=A0A6A5HQ22_CAERE|nr:hypothetical protein GCK72_007872 [Caenorhabditis remanei]KAF1767912.1 hypothetical protein GCK72_007872 [Caenorhabditis remanei]
MPFPLSYPGLLCVLEHLEAVKRAHIIGRSPGHQKIDKLIPLCLENLHIGKSELVINKLWITCEKDEVNLKMKRKTFSRQISESQEDKMKKLAHFWISGRSKIYVDRLRWFCSLPPGFLPVDLKFRVNSLNAFCDLGAAIPYIDPRSFPLKTVATTLKSSTLFDNQVVKFAETLILNLIHHRNVTVEDLKKLENKTVMIKSFWDFIIDIILLIEYHIETQKDIRTTFVISTGLPKFSIPINNETRIRVYAIDDSEEDCPYKKYFPYKIIVKPVSIVSGL